jgi:hypothetical protein
MLGIGAEKKAGAWGRRRKAGEVGCLSLVSKYETRTLIPVCFSKLWMVSGAMKSDHQKRLRTPASWAFLPDGASAVPGSALWQPLTRKAAIASSPRSGMG